mgnify:CR=1 FL=1
MSDLSANVREALQSIHLPKVDQSLVDAGMVEKIDVEGETAHVLLHFKPAYASKSQLRQWVQDAVGAVEGVGSVDVQFATQTQDQQSADPGAAAQQRQPSGGGQQGQTVPPGQRTSRGIELPDVRERIAVFSGKGGVGKSTVSLNLAVALAQQGLKVGLFDADVHGPNLPNLLGIRGQPMLENGKIAPPEKYGIKMISLGLLVEAEEALIWRGPMITKAIDELLDGTNWGELDAMIIDLPPGTGDAQLGIAQDLELTGSVGVTTPQEVSLVDMRRGITTFQRLEVPLWGLVENMSGFVCPHCGEHSDIFGTGGGVKEAEKRGVPCLGQIPLDPAIREAEDQQTPVVIHAPDSPAAQEYQKIAQAVAERIGEAVGQS